MIRAIAAIDSKRGIADEQGIPWDLPTDKKYYLGKIYEQLALVGAGTIHDHRPVARLVIASRTPQQLRPGEQQVPDAAEYLDTVKEDIWVIGGAQIYAATLHQVEELYLTLIEGDFGCTKFFPDYAKDFVCVDPGTPQTENGSTFRFTVWKRKR